jgi:hypothetical protein
MPSDQKPKNKGGRPKAPPTPPALGIADRKGEGWQFTIVLGGLKVNGKRYDPQIGADILAGMLEDGMKRIAPAARSGASPERALEDLEAADSAVNGDAAGEEIQSSEPAAPPEPAMAPGEDAANGSH